MSTITKQWLQQTIAEYEANRDELPFGLDTNSAIELQAFKLALASLEAEAAYFINRVKHSDAYGDDVELRTYCYELDALKSKDDFGGEIVPVYTAPPAPVSVPECFKNAFSSLESLYRNGQKQNWNERYTTDMAYASGVLRACRAAMLQGAEPVTKAYKLPEETGSSLQLRNLIRQRHAEWSQATFGDVGPVGPLKHLSKEALEAAAEPDDLSEWADMQFLLWDAQRRAGICDGEITAAMEEKLKVNMARQWPEPKDGEPRLHIKAAPQQEVKP